MGMLLLTSHLHVGAVDTEPLQKESVVTIIWCCEGRSFNESFMTCRTTGREQAQSAKVYAYIFIE